MFPNNDPTVDKVKRKRVLVSSDFKTGYRIKRVFNLFYELNQSRWTTDSNKHNKFLKFFVNTMTDLQKKYEAPAFFKCPPKLKIKKQTAESKLKQNTESENEDKEEEVKRKLKSIYNYRKWKYSLVNIKNVALVRDAQYAFGLDQVKDYSPTKNLLGRASIEISRGTPVTPSKKAFIATKVQQADASGG